MIVGDLMNNEIVLSGETLFVTFASQDGAGIKCRTMTFSLMTLKTAFVCKRLAVTRFLVAHVWTIVLVLVFSIRTLAGAKTEIL